MNFSDFFNQATTNSPYPWQGRLANGDGYQPDDPSTHGGVDCASKLIDIPTGLGKTAGVTLAWLWNRVKLQRTDWPRRLVYCLPMRTLVEQTEREARTWIDKLYANGNGPLPRKPRVVVLMGGESPEAEDKDWDLYPEDEAILIGTQDMLLSRALNRGYGMSRYRWPMHFALLNNDALWVMDEVQLMGVGVETTAQLAALRTRLSTQHRSCSWWMSATLAGERLGTVDHREAATKLLPPLSLTPQELQGPGRAHELTHATKSVAFASLVLNNDTKGSYAKELAALITEKHRSGSLTLVVLNRVNRARDVYETLTKGKSPLYDPAKVALIHSRFRPCDRQTHQKLLLGDGDRIVIATQAVEAGVDVSAHTLITELAPWSSLVQRMGRCNRRAEHDDAEILVVDIQPKDAKDQLCLPYTEKELNAARDALHGLENASPIALREINVPEEPVIRPVLRRRDLVDLFDTTPDLCGQDLDVSRYIRDNQDSDVQFFWRNLDGQPTLGERSPARDELCRVSIGEANAFLKKLKDKKFAWRWNGLARTWEPIKQAPPGAVVLLSIEAGGYNAQLGWTGDPKKHRPEAVPADTPPPEAYTGDPDTSTGQWLSIAQHTAEVLEALEAIAPKVLEDPDTLAALRNAALWHDVGKAHPAFQQMLTAENPERQDGSLWAKSDGQRSGRYPKERLGFRHELASALAWLQNAPPSPLSDLCAYLIAAHHGKVRLSIRSLPEESGNPDQPEALFARGVWHGDTLPPVPLDQTTTPETQLKLDLMQMGHDDDGNPSWLARTINLRDHYGPFALAYLETLLRAADARGSSLTE